MSSPAQDLRDPPTLPEWRRSGRFFLIAAALHLAILAMPGRHAKAVSATGPLHVQLSGVRQAELPPLIEPPPAPAKPAADRPQRRRPVLAMPAETAPTATAFSTPAPPAPPNEAPAAAPEPAVAATPPAAAAPALVAARFDADYLNNPKPPYPPLSLRLGEEGEVRLRVRVSADGRAVAVELAKSSGFSRLDETARRAVANWTFIPARRGDEAIEASVIVPVVFKPK